MASQRLKIDRCGEHSPAPNNSIFSYSGATWPLVNHFTPLTGDTPSALSSGTSLYLGLAKFQDGTNTFGHTLNMTLETSAMCATKYDNPADDTSTLGTDGTN